MVNGKYCQVMVTSGGKVRFLGISFGDCKAELDANKIAKWRFKNFQDHFAYQVLLKNVRFYI